MLRYIHTAFARVCMAGGFYAVYVRSPIQLLTRPDPARLPRWNKIGHVHAGSGMAVDDAVYVDTRKC